MDLRLPDGSGIEACREIRADTPETSVLILTSYADDDALFSAVMAGASGYVLKNTSSADFLADVRSALAGEAPLPPKEPTQSSTRARPVFIAIQDYSAASADEISFQKGDRLTIEAAVQKMTSATAARPDATAGAAATAGAWTPASPCAPRPSSWPRSSRASTCSTAVVACSRS